MYQKILSTHFDSFCHSEMDIDGAFWYNSCARALCARSWRVHCPLSELLGKFGKAGRFGSSGGTGQNWDSYYDPLLRREKRVSSSGRVCPAFSGQNLAPFSIYLQHSYVHLHWRGSTWGLRLLANFKAYFNDIVS